jgi:hypothetical protein
MKRLSSNSNSALVLQAPVAINISLQLLVAHVRKSVHAFAFNALPPRSHKRDVAFAHSYPGLRLLYTATLRGNILWSLLIAGGTVVRQRPLITTLFALCALLPTPIPTPTH